MSFHLQHGGGHGVTLHGAPQLAVSSSFLLFYKYSSLEIKFLVFTYGRIKIFKKLDVFPSGRASSKGFNFRWCGGGLFDRALCRWALLVSLYGSIGIKV